MLELLQRGVPPNNSEYYTKLKDGCTPLHEACAHSHLCSAELLIKFGAIVAAKDNDGWTPLHWACFNNSKDTAKLLLQHHCPTGEPLYTIMIVQLCQLICDLVQEVCDSAWAPLYIASKASQFKDTFE